MNKQILSLTLIATACAYGQTNLLDFNNETPGDIPPAIWLQTNIPAPDDPAETDLEQRNLFQYSPDLTINGTGGITLDGTKARTTYGMVYRNDDANGLPQAAVNGDLYRISAQIQIEQNGAAPDGANRPFFRVDFSTLGELNGASTLTFNLYNRGVLAGVDGAPDRQFFGYGLNSGGSEFSPVDNLEGNVFLLTGFTPISVIGLPVTPGTAATSNSIGMEMTLAKIPLADGESPLLDLEGNITDRWSIAIKVTNVTTGGTIFEADRFNLDGDGTTPLEPLIVNLAPDAEIFGALGKPFVNGANDSSLSELLGIEQVSIDNFEISSFSSSIDADGDTLSQAEEELLGTNDNEIDSDMDGFDDNVEVAAQSDPTDPASTPLVRIVVNESLTNLPEGPINNSPAFNAQASYVSTNGSVSSAVAFTRAIATPTFNEADGTDLAIGDVVALRLDFRLLGPANLDTINSLGARLALSNSSAPGTAQPIVGTGFDISEFGNGGLRFASYDTDAGMEPVGRGLTSPLLQYFDLSGYDDSDREPDAPVTPRSNGNSDWLRMGTVIERTGETTYNVTQTLIDLEGINRSRPTASYEIERADLQADELFVIFNTQNVVANGDRNPVSAVEYRDLKAAKLIDAFEDPDNDTLENGLEFLIGSNPNSEDTDGDGLFDDEDSTPLEPTVDVGDNIVIQNFSFGTNNTLTINFLGQPDTEYVAKSSSTLEPNSFNELTEPNPFLFTNQEGQGSITIPFDPQNIDRLFFRIELDSEN